MRQLIILFCLTTLFFIYGHAQYILNTPDGKKVELNRNGTWHYVEQKSKTDSENKVAGKVEYISKLKKYRLDYNPEFWYQDTAQNNFNNYWDATFNSIDQSTVARCIEYRLSYGNANLDSITKSVYENIGEIKSFKSYIETINGLNVNFYDIEVEFNSTGVMYRYLGFIYAPKSGSFQFSIGSEKDIVEEDYDKIIDFLKSFSKN